MTEQEWLEDIQFLVDRASQAGTCSFREDRDCGASSNSIVEIAYGVTPLKLQVVPRDAADLSACHFMWEKLPEHRKTYDAKVAMARAINYKTEDRT
jgi:hypothetical protein